MQGRANILRLAVFMGLHSCSRIEALRNVSAIVCLSVVGVFGRARVYFLWRSERPDGNRTGCRIMTRLLFVRVLLLIAFALVVAAVFLLWDSPLIAELRAGFARASIESRVASAGYWGPVLVIALMTVAVVASPIPSAPIALAAGAAYGHVAGTAYVVIGAELGALIAFGLARTLGRAALQRWFGDRLDMGLLGSQNALAATVFASRLMPFVSFDLVSYAAGLSCLQTWRFSLATLAGIIPASFLLAHFGGEMATGDAGRLTWAVLGLGLITGAPLLWAALRGRSGQGPDR